MSIAQVAKRAGVSSATVSRVMNRQAGVSTESISRVRRAMQELSYQPRRPRGGGSYPAVAMLFLCEDEMSTHLSTTSQTMAGVRRALAKHNINLVVASAATPEDLPPIVVRRQVDGLILTGQTPNLEVLEKIKGIPAVWLTSHHHATGDAMLPGNEQVGRIAAEYLHDKGCRTLGALNAMAQNAALAARVDFFCYTNDRLGLPPARRYCTGSDKPAVPEEPLESGWLDHRVSELVGDLLADQSRPAGLFVPQDLQLAVVHRLLVRRGVQPGRDILLVGSDNVRAALMGLWPRPATVSLRSSVVGELAVQQLMRRIAEPGGDGDGVQVSIQPVLVPGEDWHEGD